MATTVSIKSLAGSRCPLRTPDPSLEPEDETVHLRRAQRHLHPRSQADASYALDDAYIVPERLGRRGQERSYSSAPRSRPRSPSRPMPSAAGMPYVNYRWMGGMLTNFATIRTRVQRMEEIEAMKADGTLREVLPRRSRSVMNKELAKLADRTSAASATCTTCPTRMFVVDTKHEENAVREAHRLHIPIVGTASTPTADPDDDRLRHPRKRRRHPFRQPALRRSPPTLVVAGAAGSGERLPLKPEAATGCRSSR